MTERYEYVSEKMEAADLDLKLNAVAKHGWRLVTLIQTHSSGVIATFERLIPDE